MTIEEWIQGKVGFTLTDLNIQTILVDRSITTGTDASTLTQEQRELCWADALLIYATSSNKGSYKIQDGNSSESVGSEYFVDRDDILNFAYTLYKKWGVEPPVVTNDNINNGTDRW